MNIRIGGEPRLPQDSQIKEAPLSRGDAITQSVVGRIRGFVSKTISSPQGNFEKSQLGPADPPKQRQPAEKMIRDMKTRVFETIKNSFERISLKTGVFSQNTETKSNGTKIKELNNTLANLKAMEITYDRDLKEQEELISNYTKSFNANPKDLKDDYFLMMSLNDSLINIQSNIDRTKSEIQQIKAEIDSLTDKDTSPTKTKQKNTESLTSKIASKLSQHPMVKDFNELKNVKANFETMKKNAADEMVKVERFALKNLRADRSEKTPLKTIGEKVEHFFELRSLAGKMKNSGGEIILKNGSFKLVKKGKLEDREAALRHARVLLVDLHKNLKNPELQDAANKNDPGLKGGLSETDVINVKVRMAESSKDILNNNKELRTDFEQYFAEATYEGPLLDGQKLMGIFERQFSGLEKMFNRFKEPGTVDAKGNQRPDRIMTSDKEKYEWAIHAQGISVMTTLAANYEDWKSDGFSEAKRPTKNGVMAVNNFKNFAYEVCARVAGEIKNRESFENASNDEKETFANLQNEAATRIADLKAMMRANTGMDAKHLDHAALEEQISWFANQI